MGRQETQFNKRVAEGLGIQVDDDTGSGGPGRSYRKGITLAELFKMFPDDEAAREWFEATMWQDGPVCPRCHSGEPAKPSTHLTMPYWCVRCKRHFSVKVGTVMERSKIGYQKWVIALFLVLTNAKGTSSMKLHRTLGIRQPSAWFMLHRIREAMRTMAQDDAMSGPVEVDELYVGGREKNKHADKKGKDKKVAVAGIRDRKTGRVAAAPVPETTAARMEHFIGSHAEPDATVYTDESKIYSGLKNHDTICHGAGEYVRGDVHTNGMESFCALLRRGCHGTYHWMSPKHLHRFVNEFAGRLNERFRDTADMMAVLARHMVGKRLTYAQLVAT